MKKIINFNLRVFTPNNERQATFKVRENNEAWAVDWMMNAICGNLGRPVDENHSMLFEHGFSPIFMKPAMEALGLEYDRYNPTPVAVKVYWSQGQIFLDIILKY
jgi:hypothetical protein